LSISDKLPPQQSRRPTTLEYPRPFKPIRYQDGWGYKLSTWNRHLRGAIRAILHPRIARHTATTSLHRAKWPHLKHPEDLTIDELSNLTSLYDRGLVTYIATRIRAQLRRNEEHRAKQIRATTQACIKEAVTKRLDSFNLPNGKGKRFVLNSIFQKVNEQLNLKWL
jgi:hypothetical protein